MHKPNSESQSQAEDNYITPDPSAKEGKNSRKSRHKKRRRLLSPEYTTVNPATRPISKIRVTTTKIQSRRSPPWEAPLCYTRQGSICLIYTSQ